MIKRPGGIFIVFRYHLDSRKDCGFEAKVWVCPEVPVADIKSIDVGIQMMTGRC